MTSPRHRVWLVTGASSGFGRAITDAAVAAGDTVVAAARRTEALAELAAAHPDRVEPLALDVTGPAADLTAAVDDVVARHGRLDVLVNNAGRTQVGALEETTEDELRALFDLHTMGPALLTRAALPHFRAQGQGAVVLMSSVGGQVTLPGFGVYCATKFAIEGLVETLVDECPHVRFLIVEPGAFRTELFRPGAAVLSTPMPEYEDTVGPTRAFVAGNDGRQPGDPDKAAAAILRVLDADDAPLRLPLGQDAVSGIRARLTRIADDLERWEPVSTSTDRDDVG
ncbi:SDR family NAD(P)-dependent oxidoreductase [Actinomycetospora straminea]|uniref:Oxidoreductase n=1 Tax=Actinomycetospora straminea TaxID=663607 RepID=A0ABP9EYU2_9PSEU|nr:SDR family NAD(P)-dependent oxidoreductase [Actinomycetospora straminea]MDD7935578.1 SDR family NAD(P)-dependent oxidoreductase [Actinomycetospora straminea]